MIEDIKGFVHLAIDSSGQFKDIVTTSDDRFSDEDAAIPSALYAIKVDDTKNIDWIGQILQVPIRALVLVNDWNQELAMEKWVAMHKFFSNQRILFNDLKYMQEDYWRLDAGPDIIANLPNEHSFAVEYIANITVDTS